jgi:hypothetical protein
MATAAHGKRFYIEALDAAGQKEQAQQLRWAAFEERLSAIQLRAYLRSRRWQKAKGADPNRASRDAA